MGEVDPDFNFKYKTTNVTSSNLPITQALANSVWALGKMEVAPPPKLLRVLLRSTYKEMYNFTPQVRI